MRTEQVDALNPQYVQDRVKNSPLRSLGLGVLDLVKDSETPPAGPAESNSRLIETDLVYIRDTLALLLSEICTPPLNPSYLEVLDAIRAETSSLTDLTPEELKAIVEDMSGRVVWDFVPEGLQEELAELEEEQAAKPLEGGGY